MWRNGFGCLVCQIWCQLGVLLRRVCIFLQCLLYYTHNIFLLEKHGKPISGWKDIFFCGKAALETLLWACVWAKKKHEKGHGSRNLCRKVKG